MVLCLTGCHILDSKEYDLMCNKISKENKCLKARKRSLPKLSCLFSNISVKTENQENVSPKWSTDVLGLQSSPEPWRLKSLRLLLSEKADVQRTAQKQPFPLLLLPPSTSRKPRSRGQGAVRACRGTNVHIADLCSAFGKEKQNGNVLRTWGRSHIQIPLITQMSVPPQHYLKTNSSSKNTHKKKKSKGFWRVVVNMQNTLLWHS